MWWSITLGLLVLAWIVRDYRRNRLEVRVFKPQKPSEIRTTEAIKKQLAAGTFSLDNGIKISREEQYREQFSEVAMIIGSADGYPASKLAMQEVLDRFPAFAESARHLQIIGESLDIIEKTKNLKTLESRSEVVRTNQAAMFDALPFPIDAETRATQKERIDQIVRDAIANLPPPKTKKRSSQVVLDPQAITETAEQPIAVRVEDVMPDEKIAALLRESTSLKAQGNMNSAVDCLYEAKTLMLESEMNYTAETWCKLPLYLQHAGRFAESMTEFQFLQDDLPRRARRDAQVDNPSVGTPEGKLHYYENMLSHDAVLIEEKRALAQKREQKAIVKNQS